MKKSAIAVGVLLLLNGAIVQAGDDIVMADFEGNDYAGWVAAGNAFGAGPVHRVLPNEQKIDGFAGNGYVNSYLGGDAGTGTLTSRSFSISRPFISFLIGGGNHPGKTCINLIVGGKIVETATGADAEHLDWYTWDVKHFAGRQAMIQIVDHETGQWGHINIDQIVQTDNPPVPPLKLDVVYQESLRPQFHFSSASNWINDPNGMVFFGSEYHLFFQHNPEGINWGNMTWGHAVSPDMIHWTQLKDALKPDELGTIFSGSAVVDWKNTSGFGTGKDKPLVAMYTAAGSTSPESKGKKFSQCIAFSNDKGRSWTKYAGNPVIPHIAGENRDPKVIWYEPDHKWIVAIYKDQSDFALFSSADLKHWDHLQDLTAPGCSECPDFFPLELDADAKKTKWVFTSAGGKYLIGRFDGKHYTPDQNLRQVDFGRNYYAVQTFSDVPETDGRRIQIAWMRDGKYPRMPFNGQMSFPVEMTLRSTQDGPRLFREPVKELQSLYGPVKELKNLDLVEGTNPLADVQADVFRIVADVELGSAAQIGFKIHGHRVSYTAANHTLSALGESPVELENGHLYLDILVDRTSMETFANHGRVSITSCFLPEPGDHPLEIFAQGGTAKIVTLNVISLKSAWPAVH